MAINRHAPVDRPQSSHSSSLRSGHLASCHCRCSGCERTLFFALCLALFVFAVTATGITVIAWPPTSQRVVVVVLKSTSSRLNHSDCGCMWGG